MPRKLAMVHTVARLTPVYDQLSLELMPEVERIHIADEILLQMVLAAGGVTPAICRRFTEDAAWAEQVGAQVVLLTCSSISPAVDVAQPLVGVPLLKIDQPMADKAVNLGRRIGVVATATVTLKPTSELIATRARVAGKQVQVETVFCEGAHQLMLAGHMDRHDELVLGYLRRAMQNYDVVVLAQGSMARVAEQIPEAERRVPILSSPRLGMEYARDVIMQLPA